ncbi:hypothetical protein E1267_11920 [Nonomuraea longispora]|uniref:Uncharacterized protein n=1 Tax=Nonomuraea longispora TaxID=1848320 RepID=A0A4R4NLN7_9ACTN|nr:hypothetical protein [Nonomuraea longispora]TDC07922.1 hypothetical protein E1267_11920 [Nonomuraea longispora]
MRRVTTRIAAAGQARAQAETACDRAEEGEQDAWRQVGEHQNARSQADAVAQALLREKDSTARPDTSLPDAPSFEQSHQAS